LTLYGARIDRDRKSGQGNGMGYIGWAVDKWFIFTILHILDNSESFRHVNSMSS